MNRYAIIWQISSRTQQTSNVVTHVSADSPEAARDNAMASVSTRLPMMISDGAAQVLAVIQVESEG